MIFDPWQFIATPVKGPVDTVLVRMSLRNKQPVFGGKSYLDLDVSGAVQKSMGRDDLLPRAVSFVRSLCYQFPLPINPNAALLILGLKAFPRYETWEKLGCEGYTEAMYHTDARRWLINKGQIKSYDELYKWIVSYYLDLRSPSLFSEIRYQRARLCEIRLKFEHERLFRFYGPSTYPEKVEQALRAIHDLSELHVVEKRTNKKKAQKSAAGDMDERSGKNGTV